MTSVLLSSKDSGLSSRRDRDAVTYRRLYGVEAKGKRLSMVPGNYSKDGPRKSGKRSTWATTDSRMAPRNRLPQKFRKLTPS